MNSSAKKRPQAPLLQDPWLSQLSPWEQSQAGSYLKNRLNIATVLLC